MTKALRFAAAALLLPLAACAASAAATRHCASYGKAATLGELQRDGSAAIASYRCG